MKRWPRLEVYLALAGLVFLTIAIVSSWDQIATSFTWSPIGFATATLLSFAGLLAVSASWSALHEGHSRSRAFRHYLLIQPAKHIPGGVAHPVGLISSSARETTVSRSTANFLRFSLFLVAGGLSLGLLLIVEPHTRMFGVGAIVLALAVTFLALNRRLAERFEAWIVRFLPSRSGDTPSPSRNGTPGPDLARSLGLAALGIGGLSCGFAVLGSSFDGMAQPPLLVGAFGVAWAVGYAVVPFPAGLGVRESALVAILAGVSGTLGPVLAAALLQRLSQILAESLGVVVGYFMSQSRRRSDRSRFRDQTEH